MGVAVWLSSFFGPKMPSLWADPIGARGNNIRSYFGVSPECGRSLELNSTFFYQRLRAFPPLEGVGLNAHQFPTEGLGKIGVI